jgi:5-methyltetrahydrofolate--homocysteine methyltransferase
MLIVGERINATRKSIGEALAKRDEQFIRQEAINQVKAGAHIVDVNGGSPDPDEEVRNIEWLVTVVQGAVGVPLCIDSANSKALGKGLALHKGKALVNSITGESRIMEEVLPLVKKYGAGVVALTNNEKGMPQNVQERVKIAEEILMVVKKFAIKEEDLYFDCLVRPVSAEPAQGLAFLDAVREVKSLGKVNTVCGLSNVSFGLPDRKFLNATFLAMAMYAGIDAALIDPTDGRMMATLRAAEALLGKDEYCMTYIQAVRERL